MTKKSYSRAISVKRGSHWWNFVTPGMMLCGLALFMILFLLHETIFESFVTNIPLNTVIAIVTFYAFFRAFYNNLKLHRTIVFLLRIEQVEKKDEPSHEDLDFLINKLETEGSLINIQNMHMALENLSVYGHLNFSDNDARLIKSKFGARTRSERGVVSYFAGILVMLGLIGTFWGLLLTIAAVGDAMGAVSQSFSSQTNGSGSADIGQFISSISEPLQGMGIAFSSSLFGLSGSLFLGFLNFFAGRAQNEAIEMVSRWIDNRIPQLNPVLAEKVGKQKVPKSDDLKAWLSGFVYLSSKTNQKMGQIMLALSKATAAMLQTSHQTEKLYDYQKDMYMAMERMSTRMGMMKDSIEYMTKKVDPIMNHYSNLSGNVSMVREMIAHYAETKDEINERQIEQMSTLTTQIRSLNSTFDVMGQIQGSLVKEIEKLREKSQHEDNITEFTNLVWQLNTILEEIKQSNVSAYARAFGIETESSDTGEASQT